MEPYHSLGNYKYYTLGLAEYKNIFHIPSKEDIEKTKRIINSYNIEIVEYK